MVKGRPYFRGPDFFFVDGIPFREDRRGWVAWEEGGRLPDLIVEILSPSTAHIDRKDKRDLYARVFRTRQYYLVDLQKGELEGLSLAGDLYRSMRPSAQGRFRNAGLGVDFGLWRGEYSGMTGTWLRFLFLSRTDGWYRLRRSEPRLSASAPMRRRPSCAGCGLCWARIEIEKARLLSRAFSEGPEEGAPLGSREGSARSARSSWR